MAKIMLLNEIYKRTNKFFGLKSSQNNCPGNQFRCAPTHSVIYETISALDAPG